MNVRCARQQDFPDIAVINQQIHSSHTEMRPDLFNNQYHNSVDQAYYNVILESKLHKVIVVEDYNKIVGYSILEIRNVPINNLLKDRRYLLIDQIAILRSYWRQGLGQLMFSRIEEIAQEVEAGAIELNVLKINDKSVAFYQAVGMQVQSYRFEKLISVKR